MSINKSIKLKTDSLNDVKFEIEGSENISISDDIPFYTLKIKMNSEIMKYHRARTLRFSSIMYDPAGSYKKKLVGLIKAEMDKNNIELTEEMMEAPIGLSVKVIKKPSKSGNSLVKLALMITNKIRRILTPDVDNYLKTTYDTLNKSLFTDDRQIFKTSCEKRFGPEDETIITLEYYRDYSDVKASAKELISQGIITEADLDLARKIKNSKTEKKGQEL